uniref:U4/U6.U5 small nuclear ribonucleoprotein 27 kDa protein n=1 Tax=Ditylenchus dipsaci TaxID=166011 RepID=A0A915DG03_9BILA
MARFPWIFKRDRRRRSRSHERSSGGGARRNHSPVEQREVVHKSRSRSPLDRRQRSRSRERRRSPRRERLTLGSRRSRTPPRDDAKSKSSARRERKRARAPKLDLESCQNVDEEMSKLMGFGNFDTTKNKKVSDNVDGMAKINKPRKYRQYMNRKGGFNRPLDYVA